MRFDLSAVSPKLLIQGNDVFDWGQPVAIPEAGRRRPMDINLGLVLGYRCYHKIDERAIRLSLCGTPFTARQKNLRRRMTLSGAQGAVSADLFGCMRLYNPVPSFLGSPPRILNVPERQWTCVNRKIFLDTISPSPPMKMKCPPALSRQRALIGFMRPDLWVDDSRRHTAGYRGNP